LAKAVLPRFQASMTVPRWLWDSWRQDPVTSQYGPADVGAILLLARQWALLKENEQRYRMDGLGLTPKGKRDLRWRTPREAEQQREAVEKVKQLRIAS